jgi:hypothetical protein
VGFSAGGGSAFGGEAIGFFSNPKQNKNSDTRSEFLFWLRVMEDVRTIIQRQKEYIYIPEILENKI